MKKIAIIFCTLLMSLSVLSGFAVSADTTTTNNFTVAAKSAIAIDASSGKILYAQDWVIPDSHLVNASGLPNDDLNGHIYPGSGASATNTMSAKAVATLSYHLIQDFPEVLQITKKTEIPFDTGNEEKMTLTNTNQMLSGFSTSRTGVDLLKPRKNKIKIHSFAGTTNQNGFRIITVVLEATDPAADNSTPFTLTNQLMNYVYGHWRTTNLVQKNQSLDDFKEIAVTDGKEKSVQLVAPQNVTPVVPYATDGSADTKPLVIKFDKKKNATVEATITKNQKLVTLSTTVKDSLGYLPNCTADKIPLVAKKTVPRSSAPKVFWNHFVNFVNEKL